ncbi:transposase domain [Bifidobacterium minimum]|uniref:Transposase domain n=1 Tax=Bifidobacterium minimum TaxID=1693 RepID=A0A087BM74_9BIFI|nr:transposase domain [Bifidobacterium minimum]
MSTRYTKEFKERAVRLLAESRENYASETKALQGVAKDLGVAAESLRRWQAKADTASTAVPRSPASSGACAGRMRSCVGRTRSCRARRLFSPHGSTRHGIDGRVHRHSSPPVRGRADLHGPAGCAGWRVSHRQSLLAGQEACRLQDAYSPMRRWPVTSW